jgi:predicted nucleotidyltransferase
MKRKLLDISEKIDPLTVAIYELVASVAHKNNTKFFVVGATARDLVLEHGYGIKVGRATRDIDLAVQVQDWSEFEELKKGLIGTGQFMETKAMQMIQYQNRIPIDIIPFGPIKEQDNSISWPPGHEVKMNILGFDEAYGDAMPVRLKTNPVLDIGVVSPTSLVVLKLLAWKDRAQTNTRDAIDLGFIIRNYLDVGNHERLQKDHHDMLDEAFDYELAGARLLGRDIVNVVGELTRAALIQILEEQTPEGDRYPLVEDMSSGEFSGQFEANLELLKSLEQGILDTVVK